MEKNREVSESPDLDRALEEQAQSDEHLAEVVKAHGKDADDPEDPSLTPPVV